MVATPDFRLDGRIALITGASKGIGQAIAEAMAAMGAHVIVSSRRAEAVEAVADQIRDAGGSAEAVALHVGETAQIEQV
ncbi:MAG: SDR family NAD(P)-dependent oxidoreductase, partial [Candidatus Dadabacteria bacterium]